MKTQTIEVEGLPEGWKAVAYRIPVKDVDMILDRFGQVSNCIWNGETAYIIVEKIQPRRIVIEETSEETNEGIQHFSSRNSIAMTFTNTPYKWREVKETDIPLNSGDPKLSLSVDECIDATKETWPVLLAAKIDAFIKENS